jgi:signal peptidase I
LAGKTSRRLWILVALVLVFLLAKFFVADVYRIDSDSMRPTLFGGEEGEPLTEWVLVRYDRGLVPERFDLVVVRRDGAEHPIVKRVAGLRGEGIRIEGGDLLIRGERLAADSRRPEPILVFDDAIFDVAEVFAPSVAPAGPWTQAGDEWLLDGHGVAPGSNQGMMFYQPPFRDDYIMPSGRRVPGKRQVNDAILEVSFRLEEALVDRLRFQLTEEGDVFEVQIDSHPHDAGWYILRVTGIRDDEGKEKDLARNLQLRADTWYTLRFANVDNHVSVEIPEAELVLAASYDSNTEHAIAQRQGSPQHGEKSFADRVAFGGEGCRVRFRDIRILRDVFYTDIDQHGTRTEQHLGLDEYFLLGDNSAHSKDSRSFGPVPSKELIGRPVAVIWPLSRLRLIRIRD